MSCQKVYFSVCNNHILYLIIIYFGSTAGFIRGLNIRDVIPEFDHVDGGNEIVKKRAGDCPAWKPFQCPEGICIPLKYLCDYNVDCPQSGYDENKRVCTAAVRPTVESTEEFLKHQLRIHGKDYFVKIFGPKAAGNMAEMGGVSVVSVALSESPRLADFAASVGLKQSEADHLRQILKKLAENDKALLASVGFSEAEMETLQPVVEQLVDTGFLKTD